MPGADEAAPYQSLYRRYRPQRFAEVRGQDHVTLALRNAVRDGRATHAYLFSGPRGTGKTSTARILAKALNCAALKDGEPCGVCESCVAVEQGASLDVHELDAASNSGVDAMRELVARAALGTPGRWKVYIVDEVHMLSTAAANALLKTLEEPPGHVVFVLATTDPQKVLPTIRSRTQHFEFRLLSGSELASLVSDVNATEGLGVAPEAIDLVVRRGRGSARDALSALDQVAAAGGAGEDVSASDEIVEALCERDATRALIAVAAGAAAGRDARSLAGDVVDHLRDVFLAQMAPALVNRPDAVHDHLLGQARRLGVPAVVRALELVGQAQVDMREAIDPRVCLETALVRLARPDADPSPAALLERLERLERAAAVSATTDVPPPAVRTDAPAAPAAGARAALGAHRPATRAASTGALPSRDELTKVWGDTILRSLPQRAKARFGSGRFSSVEDGVAVFAVDNVHTQRRCEEVRGDVEQALATHFGVPVPLRIQVEGPPPAVAEDPPLPEEEAVDIDELRDAPEPEGDPGMEVLGRHFGGMQEVQ